MDDFIVIGPMQEVIINHAPPTEDELVEEFITSLACAMQRSS